MNSPFLNFIKNKQIALLGIARSTLSAYEFLAKTGFKLYIWDDSLEVRSKYKNSNLNIVNFEEWPFEKLDAVVTSPGISLYHPKRHNIISYIEKFNTSLLSDIELFYYFFPNYKYIGITGSNGKSSLVTFLQQIFHLAGEKSVLAGNIGVPIFDLSELPINNYVILELSSFQLSFLKKMRLHIAALLNIYSNHNSYHGSFANYKEAKFNIFKNQTKEDYALIDIDQSFSKNLLNDSKLAGNIIIVSSKGINKANFFIKQSVLYTRINRVIKNKPTTTVNPVYDFSEFNNSSDSFLQMVLFAYAISNLANIDLSIFIKALKEFKGLPHRQELIADKHGIIFVNDSKATTPKAAAEALKVYNNVYWLLGGVRKSGTLKSCAPYYNKIKHAFIFGQDRDSFAKELDGKVDISVFSSLKDATITAFNMAQQEMKKQISINSDNKAVILLSPIGTSFDEFNNFEERGNHFKKVIEEL